MHDIVFVCLTTEVKHLYLYNSQTNLDKIPNRLPKPLALSEKLAARVTSSILTLSATAPIELKDRNEIIYQMTVHPTKYNTLGPVGGLQSMYVYA